MPVGLNTILISFTSTNNCVFEIIDFLDALGNAAALMRLMCICCFVFRMMPREIWSCTVGLCNGFVC